MDDDSRGPARAFACAALCVAFALAPGCYQSHELGREDGGPVPDGGDGGVRCDEESLPAYSGPTCSDAVNACRDACAAGDETCRDACLDDPCRRCFYGTIFHCANEAGCEPVWRTFACCIQSVPMCSDLRGFDRVLCASSCPMQFMPYSQCIETMGGMECFMQAAMNCHLR